MFLAKNEVEEEEFEKVAATCLLIAGKYEETYRIPYIKNIL